MNKILLSFTLVAISAFTFAQTYTITLEGQSTDISGTVHEINASDGNEQIIDILIHNNSGASQDLKITRKRLDVPASGWSDFLCWGVEGDPFGGYCYGASQMSNDTWTTPSAATIPDTKAGLIAIHIDPSDLVGGVGLYRYYVGKSASSYDDSVDVQITTAMAGIKEVKNTSFTIYPNPADNVLSLNLPQNAQDGYVKITDVLGKVVFEQKINASKSISTETFKNGVYIVSFNANGQNYNKRFVVKH